MAHSTAYMLHVGMNSAGKTALFAEVARARVTAAGGPPPLGLHLVMGAAPPAKIGNMMANTERGVISPVELVSTRA
jgi:hypothetical protein